MELDSEQYLEKLYESGIFSDIETSQEYKKLQHKYNKFLDSIENEELKEKFIKLEEMKSGIYSQLDKDIFKLGFSVATKLIIEALNTKP